MPQLNSADVSVTSTAVDLSRLPPPVLVEQLSFEVIVAAMLADLTARDPAFSALVESDPALKIIEVCAYRELIVRRQMDDAARQLMLAFATDANLDQLGALMGVRRLEIAPATDEAPALLESDDAFRQRIVLAPEAFSVAGPELAYVFHARSADGRVADASAISPAPGDVLVTVLSVDGDGTADAALLAAVRARVDGWAVRPLTDRVTVRSAAIRPFAIEAVIHTFDGPDTTLVLDTGRARLATYLTESRRLGRDITRSGVEAALHVAGVQRVELIGWADIVVDRTQAAHCTGTTVTHGGYAL